jgi:hypothetical protein
MATNEERINAAIVQLEGDSEILHDFMHNPNPQTVTTESGVIPTIAKLVVDLSAQVIGVTTEAVTAASSAAASASTSASKAAVAEGRAADAEASAASAASSASSAGGQVAAAVAASQASATSAASALTASQAASASAQGAAASAGAASAAAELANSKFAELTAPAAADKGPALMPFSDAVNYPAGSLGAAIKDGGNVSSLRDELNSSAGSGEIGFSKDQKYPAGSVGDALQVGLERFRPSRSSALLSSRYATLAEAQAFYPHATALTQSIDWAALQGYYNSGLGELDIPDGTYVVNDDLVQSGGNVSITASPKALVKFTLNKRMRIAGTADAMPALSTNVVAGARSVVLASAPAGLKDGDVLCLFDRRDYSWSPHRAYYKAGEFVTVASVSGATVNIYGTLKYGYASANIDVYKITGGSVNIDGLRMEADPASTGTALLISFCKEVNTRGICSNAGAVYAVEIDRCIGGSASAGNIRGALTGADDYGIILSNSTGIKINSDIKAGRHCVALGGGAGICAIPYRSTRIYNSILRNLDGGAGAGDTHGNGDDTEYYHCTFDTHFNMAGKDTSAYFCHIYSRTGYADGSAVYGTEIVGGEFNLIGCKFYLNGDLASFGAIHLFPSQKLMYDWTVNVQGSRVKGTVTGTVAKFIRINVQLNETKKTTVIHEGTDYTAGNLFTFLYVRCEDDPTFAIVSDGLISDGVKRGPDGAYLIAPGIAGLANVKTRQMRQSGSVVATGGTTPTEIIAAPISFKFKYSKVPDVIPGCGNIDGVSSNLVAGRIGVPGFYSVTDSAVRPCVTATQGTWSTGAQVKLSWQAGISDM